MFSAYCKHCGTVVLLSPANVRSIHNTSNGIVLYFRCHLEHSGVWQPGRRLPGQTHGALGRGPAIRGTADRVPTSRSAASVGVASGGVASPRATSSSLSDRRRSWWPRTSRQRPSASCPGVAPRRGWLRAG